VGKPARRTRIQAKKSRHSKDYADVFRGDLDKPNLSKDRVRACLVQDRLEALINVEAEPIANSLSSSSTNPDSVLTLPTSRLGNRAPSILTVALDEPAPPVMDTAELAGHVSATRSGAEEVADLSQRLSLLQVVGNEALTIRQALSVCRKIAARVGKSATSFEQTLGMQFHF
jgi:hypothetical protein